MVKRWPEGLEMFGKELLVNLDEGQAAPKIILRKRDDPAGYEVTVEGPNARPKVEVTASDDLRPSEALLVGKHQWRVATEEGTPTAISVDDFEAKGPLKYERSTSGRDWLLKIDTKDGPAAIRLVWDSPTTDAFVGIPSYTVRSIKRPS